MTRILHYSYITLPRGMPVATTVLAFTSLNIAVLMNVLLIHVDFKLMNEDSLTS